MLLDINSWAEKLIKPRITISFVNIIDIVIYNLGAKTEPFCLLPAFLKEVSYCRYFQK